MCLIVFKGQLLMLPVIEAAIDIVEKSGGQYHVLLIIADGQVEFKVLLFALSLSLTHKLLHARNLSYLE